MRSLLYTLMAIVCIIFTACSSLTDPNSKLESESQSVSSQKTGLATTSSDMWVSAYLASYYHYVEPTGNWGNLPTEEIDWEAFTHLFYFALKVNPDGSLSAIKPYQNVSPDRINSIVTAAHNANKPVIFTVGGWGSHDGFAGAISPANRSVFISNLVNVLQTWGFDGIDIDMEPINSGDLENYKAFIKELDTKLQTVSTPMNSTALLTAATSWEPGLFAELQNHFDQINLMTYDLSGAWPDWISWHNAAVYDGGVSFPSNGKAVPSVDGKVNAFVNAGVPKQKLGIGIDFYGYIWSGGTGTATGGVTEPSQSWTTKPVVTDNVPYHEIMKDYYNSSSYRWDDQAKAAYLSIDEPGSTSDKFISYDNEESIKEKINYVRQTGLGGAIIWELTGGYQKDKPVGQRDKLLQAVKEAVGNNNSSPASDTDKPSVTISSPSEGSQVSGTTEIRINATDNIGVNAVTLSIDGEPAGEALTAAPYTYNWNTASHPNQSCIIEATAIDKAGNRSVSTITVEISNRQVDSPNPISSQDLLIFDDKLSSSWINSSWNTSVDFANSEKSFEGSYAVKAVQNKWGGFSVHSGNWGQEQDIIPGEYEAIEFAYYAEGNSGASLQIQLQNDNGLSFPKVDYGWVKGNEWVSVVIPMNELNPDKQVAHRISIMEVSGSTKTYYVDNLFLRSSDVEPVPTPMLATPSNNELNTSTKPVLTWNGTANSYQVQVATDPSFSALIIDKSGITSSAQNVNNLQTNKTYYWRVQGTSDEQKSEWSETWKFTTKAAPLTTDKYVYQEGIESPWINSSWNASVDFNSSEHPHTGTKSIKVVHNKWGGLSLHNGNWGNAIDVNTGQYDTIEFMIYTPENGIDLAVRLQDDYSNTFPLVNFGSVTVNRWVKVSIPLSDLNPTGKPIHRLNILDRSGTTKTFYIDQIAFTTKVQL